MVNKIISTNMILFDSLYRFNNNDTSILHNINIISKVLNSIINKDRPNSNVQYIITNLSM